ncbi:RusA family crossover junction endodeoxyribonuclease [Microbacterium proteolyticum]|uniref:RusA family crossover junction endodeoxyribonuclease n=1 Tax=Microbacterium proteolyticum TaxID=1572644 RepID=UPI0035C19FF1
MTLAPAPTRWEAVAEFTVHGEPIPKSRPRAKAGQQPYTPKRVVIGERNVRGAFELAYPDWQPIPRDVRLRVDVTFYRSTRHGVDVDNLLKLVTDALNRVAFADDEQISNIHAYRVYGAGADARTEVRISRAV